MNKSLLGQSLRGKSIESVPGIRKNDNNTENEQRNIVGLEKRKVESDTR